MEEDISVAPMASEGAIHFAKSCIIRVVGVGGGGCNSLQHMINHSINGVEFIAVNTDAQALNNCTAPLKVQIGVKLTNGLGSGLDPNKGRKAAEESREDIKKLLQGSHLVFVAAGMGGGTGTGAAPVIAEIARSLGALTIAVVTNPFKFEGKRHQLNASAGITELYKHVDSIIVVENDKLVKGLGDNVSTHSAFNAANDVLLYAVRGITDLIIGDGFINLDLSDIITVMSGRGHAMIGNGVGQGANFVEDAVQQAIHSPLIDHIDIRSATGLLVNARVNRNFPLSKWVYINDEIQNYANEEADCKYGICFDDSLAEDQIMITIIITGMSLNGVNESVNSQGRNNAAIRRNAMDDGFTEGNNFFSVSQARDARMTNVQGAQGAQPITIPNQAPMRPAAVVMQPQYAQGLPNSVSQQPQRAMYGNAPQNMGFNNAAAMQQQRAPQYVSPVQAQVQAPAAMPNATMQQAPSSEAPVQSTANTTITSAQRASAAIPPSALEVSNRSSLFKSENKEIPLEDAEEADGTFGESRGRSKIPSIFGNQGQL